MGELRKYGEGKFSFKIDEYMYSQEEDEFIGNIEHEGFYRLFFAPLAPMPDEVHELNEDEVKFLQEQVGCIMKEDNSGFVTVTYYRTRPLLLTAWEDIEEKEEKIAEEEAYNEWAKEAAKDIEKLIADGRKGYYTWREIMDEIKAILEE